MAFDEGLADRVRDVLIKTPRITERRMFGGLAFLADGHMLLAIDGDALMAKKAKRAKASSKSRWR